MRVITVPADVEVEVPRLDESKRISYVNETRSICKFLKEACDVYDGFAKGHVAGQQYAKLCRIFEAGSDSNAELWFEDSDFQKMERAIEEVTWISPAMNAAFDPFYQAVKDARKEAQRK